MIWSTSVDLWHNCEQFTLFGLIVAEEVYSSIVSYWGHKLSRQLSPLFHLQPGPIRAIALPNVLGCICLTIITYGVIKIPFHIE